jgi:hypothetical protein
MQKIFLIAIILLLGNDAFAKRKTQKLQRDKLPSVKLAYFGKFKYEGIIFGTELMLKKKQYTNSRFKKISENFATLNYTQSYHADLYNLGYINSEYLKRSTFTSSGFFVEYAFGFGIGKTMNSDGAVTYVLNPDGTETIKSRKTNFIMLTINTGIGFDCKYKYKLPLKVYARGGIYPIYHNAWPYHTWPMYEVGVNTNLSIFKRKN